MWNVVIVLTLIVCVVAFVLHYKNWTKVADGQFNILSGVYHQSITIDSIKDITLVDKLPKMERRNGFSWKVREKGIFNDSITGGKVYVFVDDLTQQKIRFAYADSLTMYVNQTDSLATQALFETLSKNEE